MIFDIQRFAITTEIKFTSEFEDGTTRDITIGDLDPYADALTDIKQRVIAFNNASTRQAQFPNFDSAFVSAAGSNFASLKAVEITTVDTTVLY